MKKYALLFAFFTYAIASYACTSIIISGKRTASGHPMMLKHRDTGNLDNRIQRYTVGDMSFIGLVNSDIQEGEVWTGTNSKGFSIMNTAVYNFNEDHLHGVKVTEMDREGEVMFKALAVCSTVQDFLHFLDTLPKPMGVEANFGVIDAEGGALYVETNNWRYVVFDVNEEPEGYRVQTNFAFSGTVEERMGYERYLTTCATMSELSKQYEGRKFDVDHQWFFDHISRSYRHEVLGMKEGDCPASGKVVDQDFVPRRITSAACFYEGPVMWALLAYPACGVAIPAMVCDRDRLPASIKNDGKGHCPISDTAMRIKMRYVFPNRISNGKYYVNLGTIMHGTDGKPSLLSCCHQAETEINARFGALYSQWTSRQISDKSFYNQYERMAAQFMGIYQRAFDTYLK
ncbi:MAG: hypothetical protein MJZ89_03710 [Paludibacteraceae bacterium]|nr:hypothetical protein [Paludibacteraceae bacterium]